MLPLTLALFTSVLTAPASAATLAPGQTLPNALGLHVSNGGLANLAGALAGVVPESFEEPSIAGEFECDSGDETPLGYAINGLVANIEVTDSELVASDGRLDLTLKLALSVNADEVLITGDCTFLFKDLDQSCDMDIPASDPIEVEVHLGMTMALLGTGAVDVEVDELTYDLGTIGNPLSGCTFGTVVDALLALNPDFLSDLISSFLDPTLDGLPETLETTLEDALSGLNIETSVAVLDANLALTLAPSELTLSDTGLLLGFGASVATDTRSDCADFGEGSEIFSDGWPATGERAWDKDGYPKYDAAILLNKDFMDHLLWNVWASGALCGDLADLVSLPLDTSFVGGLYGESFSAYFPEPLPVQLTLESPVQPTTRFAEDPALFIDINSLGLNTAAPLDGRWTRMCQVGVDGWIALDPNISSDGIAPDLIVDTEAFTFSEPYNELLESGYSDGIAGLLPTLLESLLPADLLPTIALPTWQGIGLDAVEWIPSDDGQWQGGFATLKTDAVEPLEISGCSGCSGDTGSDPLGCSDSTGGCDSGCDGGTSCATGGRPNVARGRLAMLAGLVALFGTRRRR